MRKVEEDFVWQLRRSCGLCSLWLYLHLRSWISSSQDYFLFIFQNPSCLQRHALYYAYLVLLLEKLLKHTPFFCMLSDTNALLIKLIYFVHCKMCSIVTLWVILILLSFFNWNRGFSSILLYWYTIYPYLFRSLVLRTERAFNKRLRTSSLVYWT